MDRAAAIEEVLPKTVKVIQAWTTIALAPYRAYRNFPKQLRLTNPGIDIELGGSNSVAA